MSAKLRAHEHLILLLVKEAATLLTSEMVSPILFLTESEFQVSNTSTIPVTGFTLHPTTSALNYASIGKGQVWSIS